MFILYYWQYSVLISIIISIRSIIVVILVIISSKADVPRQSLATSTTGTRRRCTLSSRRVVKMMSECICNLYLKYIGI